MSARHAIPFAALLIAAAAVPLRGEDESPWDPPPEQARMLETLRAKKTSFEFHDAPLGVVVDHIRRVSGINIVIDPYVLDFFEAEGRTVNLAIRDIALLDALKILLRFNDLDWTFRNGVMLITTPENTYGDVVVAMHDPGRIVEPVRDEPGTVQDLFAALQAGTGSVPMMEEEPRYGVDIEDLVCMVRESIAPDTWDMGRFRISCIGGRLLVCHTPEVHREIRDLLRDLEEDRGPAVAFQARILRVPPGALAGLGADPVLTDAQVAALVEAASAFDQPFGEYRFSVENGQRMHVAEGRECGVLAGVSGRESVLVPVRDEVMIDITPGYARREAVDCVVRFFASRMQSAPGPLASLPFLRCETATVVPFDRTRVFAAGSVPLGEASSKEDAVLAVLLRAAPAPARKRGTPERAVHPETARVRRILAEKTMSVDFMDLPLAKALEFVRKIAEINVVVDPRVYEEKSEDELMVQLQVAEIPLKQLLDLLLALKGLAYVIEDGVVIVTTLESAQGSAVFRKLPVSDLLLPVPDFEPDRRPFPFSRADSGLIFESMDDREPLQADSLLYLVIENVAPQSWDTPPNWVAVRNGNLHLRNQPAVLREVEALIETLRADLLSGVVVEGVFLETAPGWAERQGLEGERLTPAQCGAIERALAANPELVRERFLAQGRIGRSFYVTGGRQVAYSMGVEDDGDYSVGAALDGWVFEAKAVKGVEAGDLTLRISSTVSVHQPPGEALNGPGELARSDFHGTFHLADGGGVLLGSAGSAGNPAGRLLYLRVRIVR